MRKSVSLPRRCGFRLMYLPDHLHGVIDDLNGDDRYHGILVQLPLPDHINADEIIDGLNPLKDVDGLHAQKRGSAFAGKTPVRTRDAARCATNAD